MDFDGEGIFQRIARQRREHGASRHGPELGGYWYKPNCRCPSCCAEREAHKDYLNEQEAFRRAEAITDEQWEAFKAQLPI